MSLATLRKLERSPCIRDGRSSSSKKPSPELMVVMVRFASLSMAARCRQKNENQHKERRDTWDSKKKRRARGERSRINNTIFSSPLDSSSRCKWIAEGRRYQTTDDFAGPTSLTILDCSHKYGQPRNYPRAINIWVSPCSDRRGGTDEAHNL